MPRIKPAGHTSGASATETFSGSDVHLNTQTKTVKVDEWFHKYVKVEKQDGETMREALVRLIGMPAPDPDLVVGAIAGDDAEEMLERIEEAEGSSVHAVCEEMADDP